MIACWRRLWSLVHVYVQVWMLVYVNLGMFVYVNLGMFVYVKLWMLVYVKVWMIFYVNLWMLVLCKSVKDCVNLWMLVCINLWMLVYEAVLVRLLPFKAKHYLGFLSCDVWRDSVFEMKYPYFFLPPRFNILKDPIFSWFFVWNIQTVSHMIVWRHFPIVMSHSCPDNLPIVTLQWVFTVTS